jgi:glutathione synthase/RimK-type ligase-like ATP-grasp enzyme
MSATDKHLLIISSLFEPNVNGIIRCLDARGVRWFRFNTEAFPLLCQARLNFFEDGARHFELAINGSSIDSREIAAVWYRRQSEPVMARDLAEPDREFARLECFAYLKSLYHCLDHCRWVNSWLAEREAVDKSRQLAVARSVGLAIPRTLLTNDPQAVRAFLRRCGGRVVFKPLVGMITGRPPDYSAQLKASFEGKFAFPPACPEEPAERDCRVLFTQLLTRDKLEEIGALAACPAIFQEYVEKEVELRITIVGNELFTAAIHSQEHVETRVDFRHLAMMPASKAVKHTVVNLPAEVRSKLLALMSRMGLAFGCVDMILTPGGDYVFLEVNPSGQWGWIEHLTGMPITAALVELLLAG